MTAGTTTLLHNLHQKTSAIAWLRVASAALVSVSLWTSPGFAKDPFRSSDRRPISDRTEAAFLSFFRDGNYAQASSQLKQADPNDPLTHALRAAFVYLDSDGNESGKENRLSALQAHARQTRSAAQKLMVNDPMRGNLYLGVSHFLDGGYVLGKEGTVKGTPAALNEVQQALRYFDTAAAISPDDPELNLIKGYADLFMSLNLPFSSPTQAIERLEKYAGPEYLADRGVAIGYRELNKNAQALAAVDRALQATPENPDVLYLKAQILAKQGKHRDSLPLFEKALSKQKQLPPSLVKQMTREFNRAKKRVEGK
jgi:tetratricopeptide (TPR) repeat protein